MDENRTGANVGTDRLHRCWSRVLEGKRPWGAIDVQADRFGVTRYRLVVYPPGISDADRRWVRLARGWPVWGLVLWIGLEIWLNGFNQPWQAFVVATGATIGLGAVVAALAGSARSEVRTMSVVVMVGFDDPSTTESLSKLQALAVTILDADELLDKGAIAAVDHELVWWQVYDQMAPGRSPAAAS